VRQNAFVSSKLACSEPIIINLHFVTFLISVLLQDILLGL
jgi:hypothetical protein